MPPPTSLLWEDNLTVEAVPQRPAPGMARFAGTRSAGVERERVEVRFGLLEMRLPRGTLLIRRRDQRPHAQLGER